MSGHIDVQQVSKQFRVDGEPIEVLSDISLSIRPGEFVSIVGPSGCGKSTLLRLLAGLDRGFDGHILHDGKPIVGTSLDRGIVFQEPRLFPWANVRQNIGLGLQNAPIGAAQKAETIAAQSASSGCRDSSAPIRTNCPAEWRNARRSREAWSTVRRSCCSTNPLARSTR